MPSIAQQDYLRPVGKGENDCHLLAALAHNLLQGTIFDTIVGYYEPDSEIINFSKVIGSSKTSDTNYVSVVEVASPEVFNFSVRFTQTQYEGLAAIQEAGNVYEVIPDLADAGGLLKGGLGFGYIGVGGKRLAVTTADGEITALAISDEDGSNVDISWEDAQKLIGLPIS